ncbi:DHA2 family efflux MFS transporter permease subunit [Aureimonas sp. AU12]|uniref:DHA2 family efflux MFS transporter permease subunit n=1 Tax=Aureimonas sp. AU12 TaxID=1638161 RepID=UPI0007812219|nr:DHA2 family efflux MFS transporter permease subunit [Aureimonas sp. AU12]
MSVEPAARHGDGLASEATSWRLFAGFGAMCLAMFMAILDIQIVATSLPTIQAQLAIAPEDASWMQTAYLIAEIVAIPLTGFLLRRFGLRWLFGTAVLAFTLASCGCAASQSFAPLVAWRVVQGFAGGTLIPSVFAAVFLLFPERHQTAATTIAGVLAVLAPTVGPIFGGWITGTYSWHWLFLVNVAPGVLAVIGGLALLPGGGRDRETGWPDPVAVVLLAGGLAALVIGLKEAPHRGWGSAPVTLLLALSAGAGAGLFARCRRATQPLLDLSLLRDRDFAVGSAFSFLLGIALFGSVYLMPVFLAYVRGHDALEIGRIMLATGLAQLVAAPVAVFLERRVDARWLSAFGFALLALGCGLGAFQSAETDAAEMLLPQLLRGAAFMFCLLPPTRLALGHLPAARVADASALFNLMRNLGGAIGIAAIDTILYGLGPSYGQAIAERLKAGDAQTLATLRLPDFFTSGSGVTIGDHALHSLVEPRIRVLALVETTDLAWALIAALTAAALCLVPLLRASPPASGPSPHAA